MTPDILCIGSVLWDVIGRPDPRVAPRLAPGSDLPGRVVRVPGGVALNVAVALRRFGMRPALLGAVGLDAEGHALVDRCRAVGLETAHLLRPAAPTDCFLAIEGPEGVLGAIADARTLEAAGARILAPLEDGRLPRPWRGPAVIDGNLPESVLHEILDASGLEEADLRLVPASPGKAGRMRAALGPRAAMLYLNMEEAAVILRRPLSGSAEAARALVAAGARRAVVTDGPREAADATARRIHRAAPPAVSPLRVLGAGDIFVAAHVAAEAQGAAAPEALARALRAASDHVAGRAR